MRIIDQAENQLTLDMLGFLPAMLKEFDDLVRQPDGIILVTGPTGSGKSCTLYAALGRVNAFYENKKNIITMEDPVEFVLEGINQGQINVKAGFDYGDGMRAILRQDPDIVMIGEMRDLPTAEMAIKAALTGHMVYSTLHTNDTACALYQAYLTWAWSLFSSPQRYVRCLPSALYGGYAPNARSKSSPSLEILARSRPEARHPGL